MNRTQEEIIILEKFYAGILDGQVGDDFRTDGGSVVWTAIKDGKITRFKQGPGGKNFNGRENERFEGVLHILQEWVTEEEILEFFQHFGWLMKDLDVKAYSAKFKA